MHGIKRRTNNNLEGWHMHLNRAIGKSHVNIYEFVLKRFESKEQRKLLYQIGADMTISNFTQITSNKSKLMNELTFLQGSILWVSKVWMSSYLGLRTICPNLHIYHFN